MDSSTSRRVETELAFIVVIAVPLVSSLLLSSINVSSSALSFSLPNSIHYKSSSTINQYAGIHYTNVDTGNTTTNKSLSLFDPQKKEIAMQLVSSAENSSLDWKAQYSYIEDISDKRGYTAGIIGFTTATGDLLTLVEYYTSHAPDNILAKYIPALKSVEGTASHKGLDPTFVADWKTAAKDPVFQASQNFLRDSMYFDPSVTQAIEDGLGVLGQFIYYDAIVMHGPGDDAQSFGGIRAAAMAIAKTPAQGGDEIKYLNAFLDARKAAMALDPARWNTDRIDTEQRLFLDQGNLNLALPLTWQVSGQNYTISDCTQLICQ
ncbi:MAG TPA: chitosanase [Legionellaceae bacterium]|nr:chitosanase [Legionellaceae bacterium]